MRFPTNEKLKDRKTLTIGDFRGVDFSTSSLDVATKRAVQSRNMINEDGINHKRSGWDEKIVLPYRINGIFEFDEIASGTKVPVLIVHAGTKFYRVLKSNYSFTEITSSGVHHAVDTTLLRDDRSQAFYNLGKLYITGCGDFLVYGKYDGTYQLRRVYGNDDTTIPTTTISIDNIKVDDSVCSVLDDVNMLSPKRKNNLLGAAFDASNEAYQFALDASVDRGYEELTDAEFSSGVRSAAYQVKMSDDGYADVYGTKIEIVVRTHGSNQYGDYLLEYTIDNRDRTNPTVQSYPTESLKWNTLAIRKRKTLFKYKAVLVKETYIDENGQQRMRETEKTVADPLTSSETEYIYANPVYCGWFDDSTGTVTLQQISETDFSLDPQIEGRDNITVTFTHRNAEYERRICGCSFGATFGVNGLNDRLFLSGNAEWCNIDFHSASNDFTYFSDVDTASMGSDQVPIVGYSRLSDSTMAVFKEESKKESSIYFRTGEFKSATDSDGNVTSYRAIFPRTAGALGRGVVSRYAFGNLAGDVLILTGDGVCALVLGSNVAVQERYARERSRLIDRVLCQEGLSEAVATVNNDRYYLAVGGKVFVADARYRFTMDADMDDTYNYEWWYWDGVDARVFASQSKDLIFGTKNGQICLFDHEEFNDRTYTRTALGDMTYSIVTNKVTFSAGMQAPKNGEEIVINTTPFYCLLTDTVTVSGGYAVVGDDIDLFFDGDTVYADTVGASGLAVNTAYTVKDIDRGDGKFKLYNGATEVSLSSGGFKLYTLLTGEKLYVRNVSGQTFEIGKSKTGETVQFSGYNGSTPTNILAHICHKTVVESTWYTPVMNFGTSLYAKTVLGITLSKEPTVCGRLKFGYDTRNVSVNEQSEGVGDFDFTDVSFEEFYLDKGLANSFTFRCNERNCNFIRFFFSSDTDEDCAVNAVTVLYKLNMLNRGMN